MDSKKFSCQGVWENKSPPTERVCVTLINVTLNEISLNELRDGLPGLSEAPDCA